MMGPIVTTASGSILAGLFSLTPAHTSAQCVSAERAEKLGQSLTKIPYKDTFWKGTTRTRPSKDTGPWLGGGTLQWVYVWGRREPQGGGRLTVQTRQSSLQRIHVVGIPQCKKGDFLVQEMARVTCGGLWGL